ncbi:hypothetical protein ATCC90586_010192 [Pythium insidiosum]|nr:hypothetical protein ATCC90586_010192 [Pythium insidiosum]
MVASASDALSDGHDGVIAQYLVTKLTWWGSYRRLLTVSSSHLSTFNPETFECSNQWFLGEISAIELGSGPDQFVLVFERSRFRSAKVRFHCAARSHFLALVHGLRRHYTFLPPRTAFGYSDGWRQHYRCTEHFADDSYAHYLLQVGVAGITLLDEHGRKIATFPFVTLQRVASSTAHPDGLVLSSLYQERLFLCHPRNECIEHITAGARALGVTLVVEESPLNMQLLRLRHSQLLDSPSAVSFEVDKSVDDDGKIRQPIQLIFQGDALLEVHRKQRAMIHRPYAALLNVVRSDWDSETVVLQFAHSENLVVRVEARDQFIAILLLICREAGHEHVELSPSTIKKSRMFHPHSTENVRETAGTSMEAFFLRRIVHASASSSSSPSSASASVAASSSDLDGISDTSSIASGASVPNSGVPAWMARRRDKRRRRARVNALLMEGRQSFDTGLSLNDSISLTVAMEELNANVALGGSGALSEHAPRELLNRAIDALIEHLLTLVTDLRRYADSTTSDIVTTLQALSRLAQSRHAYFAPARVPRLFDALHELLLRGHFLTSYWCLKLLQSYFEPRKGEVARLHRAKALQNFVENRLLLHAILDLLPAHSALSANSSGKWVRHGKDPHSSEAAAAQPLDRTLYFTKEQRLEKDMNIVMYEALFTLHHVLIYLQAKEKQESEASEASLQRSMMPNAAATVPQHASGSDDWLATLDLERETPSNQFAAHLFNLSLAAHAKHLIGERLLDKYKFLMDAVVDIRLARARQTIIALLKFLVFHFYADERTSRGDLRRGSSGHEPPAAGATTDDRARRIDRQIDELKAFLACYDADVATLNDRSRLFQVQQTILVPLLGFSQATTDSNANSFFNVSGMMATKRDELTLAHLELNEHDDDDGRGGGPPHGFDDDDDEIPVLGGPLAGQRAGRMETDLAAANDDALEDQENRPVVAARRQSVADRLKELQLKALKETRLRLSEMDSSDTTPLRPLPLPLADRSSEEETKRDGEDDGASGRPPLRAIGRARFNSESDFTPALRPRDLRQGAPRLGFRSERDLLRPRPVLESSSDEEGEDKAQRLLGSAVDSTADSVDLCSVSARWDRREKQIAHREMGRSRAQSISASRASAHNCDACICCNDVCEHDGCFFCAEKEYQLRMAFASSSSVLRERAKTSSVASSYFNVDRKYSSCELRRHQHQRSCWVLVDGLVYDVTDLLGVHSGGMQALLDAARAGQDCGDIMRQHPPEARRMLAEYRLGEFYACERRTLAAGS